MLQFSNINYADNLNLTVYENIKKDYFKQRKEINLFFKHQISSSIRKTNLTINSLEKYFQKLLDKELNDLKEETESEIKTIEIFEQFNSFFNESLKLFNKQLLKTIKNIKEKYRKKINQKIKILEFNNKNEIKLLKIKLKEQLNDLNESTNNIIKKLEITVDFIKNNK